MQKKDAKIWDKVVLKTVKKSKIRNKGIGDYKQKGKTLHVMSAPLKSKAEELGVKIHELVESHLVKKRGISFKAINDWDKKHKDYKGEPGEIKGAPYFKEHAVANKIEKLFVKELKK